MMWVGEYSRDWVKHFAVFPTAVENGTRTVWLQNFWRRYVPGGTLCEKCQIALSDRVVGHWQTTSSRPRSEDR